MTAVVGILNKQAVALAADSAVTISGPNNKKIFNRANKVFTLSKYHPVGIMLYNSASFMSTPWETIIKSYRNQLNKKSFPTVQGYQEDFIQYLHTKDFFTNEATKKLFARDYFSKIISYIIKDSVKSHPHLVKEPTEENKVEVVKLINSRVDLLLEEAAKNDVHCGELKDLSIDSFNIIAGDVFSEVIDNFFTKNGFTLAIDLVEKIKTSVKEFVRSQHMPSFTGLIFTGFGEDEIYPALIPVNVSFVFGD